MVGMASGKYIMDEIEPISGKRLVGIVFDENQNAPYPEFPDMFYLDGYSLVGSGTQADPIRASGSVNYSDYNAPQPAFNYRSDAIQINWNQVGGVWVDGGTITFEGVYMDTQGPPELINTEEEMLYLAGNGYTSWTQPFLVPKHPLGGLVFHEDEASDHVDNVPYQDSIMFAIVGSNAT